MAMALPRSLYIGFIIGICYGVSLAAAVPTAFEPFRFPRIHPLPQKSLEIHLSYCRPLLALRRLPIGVLDRRLHLRPPLQLLRHLSKIKGWELLVLSSLVLHSGNQSSASLSLLHPPLSGQAVPTAALSVSFFSTHIIEEVGAFLSFYQSAEIMLQWAKRTEVQGFGKLTAKNSKTYTKRQMG